MRLFSWIRAMPGNALCTAVMGSFFASRLKRGSGYELDVSLSLWLLRWVEWSVPERTGIGGCSGGVETHMERECVGVEKERGRVRKQNNEPLIG